MYIDTHCHLDFPEFDQDIDEVIQRANKHDVGCLINIGADLLRSEKSVALSRRYNCVYATVGLHPHDANSFNQDTRDKLAKLADQAKVVAIGEIGLDYYKNYSQQKNQLAVFTALLTLAKDKAKPVVIHSRQAQSDTLKVLRAALPLQAVVHCFSGDENFLKDCLALGFFISFTCNITYKKAENLRQLVKLAPLERLMLETDAPFLSPEGFRGARNEPYQVRLLAEEVARLRGLSVEEVARATTQNAKAFFRIP